MFCPKCGAANKAEATFCASCGDVLPLPVGSFQSAKGSSDNSPERRDYYKAILGPKNQTYYLEMFSRFDDHGKVSASWHWPAFFVTFYWLLYRKMWIAALIYFFLPSLFMGLIGGVGALLGSSFLIGVGYMLCLVGIMFLIPMYANALYYRYCTKQITAVNASTADVQRRLGELSGKGGTSNIAIIILLIFVFIAMLGIFAAIAIPAYQDYTIKARMHQAYELGKSASVSVSDYYNSHHAIPSNLSQAGFSSPMPHFVRGVDLNARDGTLTVTVEGNIVGGQSFSLVPTLDAGGNFKWTCMSDQIQGRYLPQPCSHKN